MARYLQHFMTGVRADVEQLVAVDFEVTDPQIIQDLFDAVMILKMAQKTLPPYAWKQCGAYRNGLISYKHMNSFLESYMGTRLRAELALRRQWPSEKKKDVLREYVNPPSLVKKKKLPTAPRGLPAPIVNGHNPFAVPQFI